MLGPDARVPLLPASILVTLDTPAVLLGRGTLAHAVVRDAYGTRIDGAQVTWSVDGTDSVAVVHPTGALFGLHVGTARIVAGMDGLYGSSSLDVARTAGNGDSRAIETVRVALASISLAVGATMSARAIVVDTSGRIVQSPAVAWSIDGAPGVATVTSKGVVAGKAEGVVRVKATAGVTSGLVMLNVTGSGASAAVQLPALPQIIETQFPTVTGKRWDVKRSGQFQSALNAARRGDEIVLESGATLTGNFTLPAKAGSASDGWILVRSEDLASLEAGVRVTPAMSARMARVETSNQLAALATARGASGWYLAGIEVTVDPSLGKQQFGIVLLGDGSREQRDLSDVPSDIVLDRMYIHGQSTTNTSRCLALNSARTAVLNSYLSECHGKGFDSQAIAGWNGPGPFKIVNNTLIGAGENVMFGGADPAVPGLVPSDIEVRGNYIFTPVSWKGVWTKKNLFELKNAQRLLLDGNVLDGSWTDGQVGTGIALKSSNQSGSCTWCVTRDITIRNNLMRNVGQPFNLAGRGNSNAVGEAMGRVLIENTIVENVNVAPYTGDPRMLLLLAGTHDVTIRRNTMTSPARFTTFLTLDDGLTNIVIESNVFSRGAYGILGGKGKAGMAAFDAVRGEKRMTNNVIIGARPDAAYPPGTRWAASANAAHSIANVGADARLPSTLAKVIVP